MHAHALLLVATAALAAASQLGVSPNRQQLAAPRLAARQDSGCSFDQTLCGAGCIDLTEECCPDASFCLADQYCTLGDNDVWGCCELGALCAGDAAQSTIYNDGGAAPTAFASESAPTPTFSGVNDAPTLSSSVDGFAPLSATAAAPTAATQATAATGGSGEPRTTVVQKAGAVARAMPTAAAVAAVAFALL